MTINELKANLDNTLDKLKNNNIDDQIKLELEILVLQLKKQLLLGVFDRLKEIDNVTVANISKLPDLVKEVDNVIADEKKRNELIQKIITLAKMGLKAGGLPIPS